MKPAKSVIEIWLWGGPSQLETFDPKPNADRDFNGGLKAIPSSVPGMELHEWWPELAKCAELFSVIRSMTHDQFGHESATYLMQTGRLPGGGEVCPAIGTVIAQAKKSQYRGDLPPSVIITRAKGRFSEVGFLGPDAAPLVTGGQPNSARFTVDGIVPPASISPKMAKARYELLAALDLWQPEPGCANAAVADAFQYDNKLLIEECVVGREIECAVLGTNEPFAALPGEVIPQVEFYSYDAKYIMGDGAQLSVPAKLTVSQQDTVREIAVKAFKVLECSGMSRIDFFLRNDGQWILNEINTIPGFTNISMYPRMMQASGITYSSLIDKLIQFSLS